MRTRIPARSHARLRIRFRPARSGLRLRSHQKIHFPRDHRVSPQNHVALSRVAAHRGRTDRRPARRFHATRQSAAPRESSRHPRTLRQERRRQLPYPFLQRPRRQRCFEPREGTWFQNRRLRVHGQPRQLRRRQRCERRFEELRFHSVRSRTRQDSQLTHLRLERHRHQRPLRRSESSLRRDRRKVRLGVCERQYAPLLRRRLQEHGV